MDEYQKQAILDSIGNADYSGVVIKLLETDPNLKNRVSSIYEAATDSLKKSAKSLKLDDKKISDELTKKFINQVKQDKPTTQKESLNIATILGQTEKMGFATSMSYNSLRRKLIGRIKEYVDSDRFKPSVSDKNPITAADILGVGGPMGMMTSMRYGRLRWNLIGKLNKYVNSEKFRPSVSDKNPITAAEILGVTGPMGIMTSMRYGRLRWKLIGKLSKYVDNINPKVTGDISVADIMGVTPQMGLITRLRFNKLRRKLMKKIERQADGKESGGMLGGIFGKAKGMLGFGGKKTEDVFATETTKVDVAGFTKKSINDLKKAFFKKEDDKKPDKKKIPGWLAAIFLGLGGVIGLFSGLFDKGPLKGLKKLIGKGAIFAALKIASKTFAKGFSKPILKAIPFIGTAIGIGYGISRLKQKDYLGAFLEFGGALVDLIPGIGVPLSLGIDAILAWRDIKGGGPEKLAKGKGNQKWAKEIVPILSKVPGIDTIVQLGKAVVAFTEGNWRLGLYELSLSFPGTSLLLDLLGADTGATRKGLQQGGKIMPEIKKMGRRLSRNLVKMMVPKRLEAAALKWFGLGDPKDDQEIKDLKREASKVSSTKKSAKSDFDDLDDILETKEESRLEAKKQRYAEIAKKMGLDPKNFTYRQVGPGGKPTMDGIPIPESYFNEKELKDLSGAEQLRKSMQGLGGAIGEGATSKKLDDTNLYLQGVKTGIDNMLVGLNTLIDTSKETKVALAQNKQSSGDSGSVPDDVQSTKRWPGDKIHEYQIDVFTAMGRKG